MAVNYSTAVKNARLQAAIDAIGSAGLLKIGTTGMGAVLATITLGSPAFSAPSGGAMNLNGAPISDTAADATGTAAAAQITTSGGTVVIDGLTVSTTGANINLNSVAIQVNQTVTISSGTITHG
jgi:hypothetical protein